MTYDSLTSRRKGAELILEAAEADGIPAPQSVNLHAWPSHITLLVRDTDDVRRWALWLGRPDNVHTTRTNRGEYVHSDVWVDGEKYDQPVRVHAYITHVVRAVSH